MFFLARRPRVYSDEITLREAVPADARGIIEVANAVGREKTYNVSEVFGYSEADERSLIARLDRSKELILVAECEGRIIGFLTLYRYFGGRSPKVQHVGEIGINILDGYRDKGLGYRMMNFAIDWARRRGYTKLCLSVFSTNERAIYLYKKCGFVEEGRRKAQFKIGDTYVDEIEMGLFL
ncbi:MAG: GNAT family N-acetyltransferase [Thermoanaerobacteraceae bacterium]|nr:GNAT family N-acetyltransferase [Thermoanaerobacteraceae bacterium]